MIIFIVILVCSGVLAALGGAQPVLAAAPTKANVTPVGRVGLVTILEGKATVIHGLSQFDAAEGVRLFPGDLIHTEPKSLLRVEYTDECSLEAGPDTQLQLFHPAEKKRGNRPSLYMLQGWLKLGCKPGTEASFTLKDLDVVGISQVVVIRAIGSSRAIFAEQGTARVIRHRAPESERRRPGESDRRPTDTASVTLNAGDFLVVQPDEAPEIRPRPAADFMEVLPRAYRDTLPSRYSTLITRAVEPQNPRTFAYTDVEPWLNAEVAIRRQFVGLWIRKVNDPAFRGPLDRDLALHPEWDRILHPEKYEDDAMAAPPRPDSGEKSVPKSN